MKAAHVALFQFAGPPEIGEFVRLFRLVGLFAHFAMSQKRFPILNRAWADLERFNRTPRRTSSRGRAGCSSTCP